MSSGATTMNYELAGDLKIGQVGIANLRIRTLDVARLTEEMRSRVQRAPKLFARAAVVIDFGINVLPDGQIVGDVDYAAAREVASAITPVPGGTGLVTNALLARNCLIAAQRQRRDEERERERQMRRASQ